MQFTSILALFVAVTGISAAPTVEKRLESVPLAIYLGQGCNTPPRPGSPVIPVTTAYIPTDGSCFSISPIISGNTDSGMIRQTDLAQLPVGCYLTAYSTGDCTSQGTLLFDKTGECKTFGPGRLIISARASGACA